MTVFHGRRAAAGEFRGVDPSGKSRKITGYRGQVLVVQFLYTTCAHCQAAPHC